MKKSTAAFILILLFVSCEKSENSPDILSEKTNLLTAGVWHLTDYSHNTGIANIVVTYNSLPACKQDDLRSFNKDGTGDLNEGPTKCNSTDPQSIAVQWNFVNGQTNRININGIKYSVDKLDNTTLDISKIRTDPYDTDRRYVYSR